MEKSRDKGKVKEDSAESSQNPPSSGTDDKFDLSLLQTALNEDAVAEWEARIEELEADCGVGSGKAVPESRKRALHARVELLRMDLNEVADIAVYLTQLSHTTQQAERQKQIKQSPIAVSVAPLFARLDALRSRLAFTPICTSTKGQRVRLGAVLLWVLYFIPIFFSAAVFRLLDPLFRLLRLPARYYPLHVVRRVFCRGVITLLGIEVHVQGMENVQHEVPTLTLFTHASNLDPIMIEYASGAHKWIGKRTLFRIPIIGWLLHAIGDIPIDRENLKDAIQSLDKANAVLTKRKDSVAIAPEGTRSTTGQIREFKKGPFHLAHSARAKLVPAMLQGNYQLFPPHQKCPLPGVAVVRFLPPIDIDPSEDFNTLLLKVRRRILEESKQDFLQEIEGDRTSSKVLRKSREIQENARERHVARQQQRRNSLKEDSESAASPSQTRLRVGGKGTNVEEGQQAKGKDKAGAEGAAEGEGEDRENSEEPILDASYLRPVPLKTHIAVAMVYAVPLFPVLALMLIF